MNTCMPDNIPRGGGQGVREGLGWIKIWTFILLTSFQYGITNTKLAMKKLRLGANKCFNMHIGKAHEEYKNVQLLIDGWSVKTVENNDTGNTDYNDILGSDMNKISNAFLQKWIKDIY